MADADIPVATIPVTPVSNAFASPDQQLAFPDASIDPGKTSAATALAKADKMRKLAAYLNRPGASQMGQSAVAPTAPVAE
jgi:hypothetical protein